MLIYTKLSKKEDKMTERLAKFIARSGVCSRREAEELIKQKEWLADKIRWGTRRHGNKILFLECMVLL